MVTLNGRKSRGVNIMTRKQFDILEMLATGGSFSQRQIKDKLGWSLGLVNKTIKELADLGAVEDGRITASGREALEPYRVKRAVFLAAGFGTRLVPLTFNAPKPLIRVKGQRIIDGLIDACLAAGITEIYIVRGYLAEQFDQLLYKYPMVKFLENPAYNDAGNIASAMVARYMLSNAYVFEADIVLNDPSLIKPYHYSSNFIGVKKERSDDWCFTVKDGIIQSEQLGAEGDDVWEMVGISYWNDADGRRLSADIESVFNSPGGKERYWEQVPLVYRKENYKVEVRGCNASDIYEIDTYAELKAVDKTYDV